MLKSQIQELALFYDLEWVPDAAGSKRLFDLPEETTEIEAMQRLWEHSPQYDAEKNPRPFLKYMFSRVVSIAFLSRKTIYREGEKVPEFSLNSLPKLPVESDDVDEAAIIDRFLYIVGDRRPQLVGYNSSESDLQVLIQRGIINEITAPKFNERPGKPWEGPDYFDSRNSDAHLDLLTKFSNRGGMSPRLDELAKLCGFPGKIDVRRPGHRPVARTRPDENCRIQSDRHAQHLSRLAPRRLFRGSNLRGRLCHGAGFFPRVS